MGIYEAGSADNYLGLEARWVLSTMLSVLLKRCVGWESEDENNQDPFDMLEGSNLKL